MPHLCLYCMPGRKLNEETMFPPKYCLQDFGHCGKVTQTKSSQDCHTTKRNIFICLAATQPFHRPANLLQVLIVCPYFRGFFNKKVTQRRKLPNFRKSFWVLQVLRRVKDIIFVGNQDEQKQTISASLTATRRWRPGGSPTPLPSTCSGVRICY